MIIRYLKTGNFSIHPVYGPVVMCREAETENEGINICDGHGKILCAAGWAEEITVLPSEDNTTIGFKGDITVEGDITIDETSDDETETSVEDENLPPYLKKDWNPKAEDAKTILENYSMDKFEIDLDKRKSVDVLITEIEELRAEDENDN